MLGCWPARLRDESHPAGRKVFIVLYRIAGAGSRLRKYTIGPYGRVARAQAQKIFAARLDGRDPAEEKRESRRRLVIDQISDLVEAFIQQRVLPLRTAKVIANASTGKSSPVGAARAFTRSKNVT